MSKPMDDIPIYRRRCTLCGIEKGPVDFIRHGRQCRKCLTKRQKPSQWLMPGAEKIGTHRGFLSGWK